jgi:hypothetical protein
VCSQSFTFYQSLLLSRSQPALYHITKMFSIVLFVCLLPIALHADPTTMTTTSDPDIILQCGKMSLPPIILNKAGDTVSLYMKPPVAPSCEEIRVSVRTVDNEDNLYVLFPDTQLTDEQRITIMASSQDRPEEKLQSIAECRGATEFCAPIIILRNNITIKWSSVDSDGTARMVIVATKKIPYTYYLHNQMYSSVAGYVLFIILQIILIIAFILCFTWLIRICHRRLVANRENCHHHHHRRRRHHHHHHHCHPGDGGVPSSVVSIDAPPVYTLSPPITDEKP